MSRKPSTFLCISASMWRGTFSGLEKNAKTREKGKGSQSAIRSRIPRPYATSVVAVFHMRVRHGRGVQEKSKRMNSEGIQSVNPTACGRMNS
jgi:hypothetical protein